MRIKLSLISIVVLTLFNSYLAVGQTTETRPRRVGVETIVGQADLVRATSIATGATTSRADDEPGLDAMVPRDGLQGYLEISSEGFSQLMRSGSALEPVRKLFGANGKTGSELPAFAMSNMKLLANSRLALASYGATSVAMIQAASEADAQQMKAGVARLVAAGPQADAETPRLEIGVRGRVVIAGPAAMVERIVNGNLSAISEDSQFAKARQRFAGEPFFAYVDFSSLPRSLPTGDLANNPAYVAGAMGALNSMPVAIGLGGSIQGDTATLRALTLGGEKKAPGPFSGLLSAGNPAESSRGASSFVPADSDVFVDISLNWEKVIETLESVFSNPAVAGESGQKIDLLAAAETALGFSIKDDLLPTLGGEIAISLSGLAQQPAVTRARAASAGKSPPVIVADEPLSSSSSKAVRPPGAVGAAPPRTQFMLVLSLRDPVKFEKLVGKLINAGKSAPAPMTKTPYRGAVINTAKSVSYAISGSYFIASGNVASVRRALDVQATGTSLASSAEFRSAVGSSHHAMLQAYLSSRLADRFVESFAKGAQVSSPPKAAQTLSGIGLTMTPDPDGLLIEARMPSNVAFTVLGAMASNGPRPYGITSDGGDAQTGPQGGKRTPRMTMDDVRRP
jgi:uncharacterized protein DUF3352